jgi:hypothetical protein
MPSDNIIFREAIDGYGFTEVEQQGDGVFCTGCGYTHKRPTKMYTNGQNSVYSGIKETICRHQVIHLYNPFEANP